MVQIRDAIDTDPIEQRVPPSSCFSDRLVYLNQVLVLFLLFCNSLSSGASDPDPVRIQRASVLFNGIQQEASARCGMNRLYRPEMH